MKRLSGTNALTNSVQLKFAATFLILIAGLLVMLNIYPTIVSRDLIFTTKQTALQTQAGVISSSLSAADRLTSDTVEEVMGLIDIRSLTRIIVTDERAKILYDTAELGAGQGSYALFSEIERALRGDIICYSVYDGKAFCTREAMPIKNGSLTVGAVYLYEYDSAQAELIISIQKNLRNITFVLGLVAIILMFIFSRALTRRITALVHATRTVSEGNYDTRIVTAGNDELSQLGREFNSLTQRLKDTEELRRRFVSDASHELKTPLASIRLLSDSIVNADNMDMGTLREFVTDIGNEAERLSRTTEKLLSLSKLDSGTPMSRERLDIRLVAEKTLHLLAPLAREHQIILETDLHKGCLIYGSEDLVYRIIFNLAENSIKYNLPGGRVKILLYRRGDRILLTVEDTGIGIPEEDLPHIFSRFYRVDKARSRDAGGSGLGLSIVYDAIGFHNGEVRVENRAQGGTRFVVSFPVYREQDSGSASNEG